MKIMIVAGIAILILGLGLLIVPIFGISLPQPYAISGTPQQTIFAPLTAAPMNGGSNQANCNTPCQPANAFVKDGQYAAFCPVTTTATAPIIPSAEAYTYNIQLPANGVVTKVEVGPVHVDASASTDPTVITLFSRTGTTNGTAFVVPVNTLFPIGNFCANPYPSSTNVPNQDWVDITQDSRVFNATSRAVGGSSFITLVYYVTLAAAGGGGAIGQESFLDFLPVRVTYNVPTIALTVSFGYVPIAPTQYQVITFSPQVTGGAPPYSYKWTVGTATFTNQTLQLSFGTVGFYNVTLGVTDSAANTAVSSQKITITPGNPSGGGGSGGGGTGTGSLQVLIGMTGTQQIGKNVTFTALTTGGTAPFLFVWSFGDGTTVSTTTASIQHAYATTGTYTVTLVATDSASRSGYVTSSLSIGGQSSASPFAFLFPLGFYATLGIELIVAGSAVTVGGLYREKE